MAKRHDENKCLRSFGRIGKVGYDKTLQAPKNAVIGIHLWGKIDYLVHYCGYVVTFSNTALYSHGDKEDSVEKENTKAVKRAAKLNMAAMTKAAMRRVKSK